MRCFARTFVPQPRCTAYLSKESPRVVVCTWLLLYVAGCADGGSRGCVAFHDNQTQQLRSLQAESVHQDNKPVILKKCQRSRSKDIMNHDRVEMLREKLDNFTISDYHGLNSPGLTCYLNSVLQVLFMTEDFREAVERCCSEDSTTIDPQLRRLFAHLRKRKAKTKYLIETLGITNVYEQRDAAEYFEKILGLTSPEAAKIFKGELNHRTTCLKCKERNDSRGFFWILPLAVDDLRPQTYSVENGLKAFFKGEKVCGENRVYCSRCNKKRDADFECEMTQSPEILTLLLKRFSFDYKRRCYVKLHCNVDVPETLHMESCKYDLYALVNHFGNLTGGHYTAQIKSFETHTWYHFNDDVVNRVIPPLFGAGNNPLRSRTAYLLMYRKVSRHTENLDEGNQQSLCTRADVDAEGRRDETEGGEALVPDLLKDERCNGGGNLKRSNVDELKKSHDDTVWKKQTHFSRELNEQRDPRAACVRPHREMLRQTCTGADGEGYRPRGQTQESHFAFPPNKCLNSISPKRDEEKMQHVGTADGGCRLAPTRTVTRGERAASGRARRKAAESKDQLKTKPWK